MKYLKATRLVKITYNKEEQGKRDLTIKKYSDSDWAGNHAKKKLTSGFVFMLNKGFVSWCAKNTSNSSPIINRSQIRILNICGKRSKLIETVAHQSISIQGMRPICKD